jgi:hypothetical protein
MDRFWIDPGYLVGRFCCASVNLEIISRIIFNECLISEISFLYLGISNITWQSWVWSKVRSHGICGRKNGTGAGFLRELGFPCQFLSYHLALCSLNTVSLYSQLKKEAERQFSFNLMLALKWITLTITMNSLPQSVVQVSDSTFEPFILRPNCFLFQNVQNSSLLCVILCVIFNVLRFCSLNRSNKPPTVKRGR